VTLVANAFLEVMADVTIAHLLLEAALVAETKRAANDDGAGQGEDDDFYTGKVLTAKYYVNFVLPLVHAKVGAILTGDRSALDMPDAGFSAAH